MFFNTECWTQSLINIMQEFYYWALSSPHLTLDGLHSLLNCKILLESFIHLWYINIVIYSWTWKVLSHFFFNLFSSSFSFSSVILIMGLIVHWCPIIPIDFCSTPAVVWAPQTHTEAYFLNAGVPGSRALGQWLEHKRYWSVIFLRGWARCHETWLNLAGISLVSGDWVSCYENKRL